MLFESNKAIYLQIYDLICENILNEKWKNGDRIPSVREMALNLEVNPNTVNRTYSHLEGENIIHNKRGIGYFVTDGSREMIKKSMKENFLNNELPLLIKKMKMLDINANEVITLLKQ
jgi:GntR family transcriptional regulator